MSEHLGKSTLGGGIVHITVGHDKVPFDVHFELLCDCSPYFEDLFQNRRDKDVNVQPIRFPNDDPELFTEVIGWMYRGRLSAGLSHHAGIFLIRLWVLAGKFQMTNLQNDVMSVCKAKIDKVPRGVVANDSIEYIYAHTLPGSPMRRLAVDVWVRNATKSCFLSKRDGFPRAFLEDLCCALIAKNENGGMLEDEDIGFEQRYFVCPTPLTDRDGDALSPRPREEAELATPATSAQMQSRRVKSPVSRINRSSVLSPITWPSSTSPSAHSDSQREETDEVKVKTEAA